MSKSKLKTNQIQTILDHPDREEIINKLVLGIEAKDIAEWLQAKYSEISDRKICLSVAALKKFNNEYLDIYTQIKADLNKTKSPDIQLRETVQGSPSYHRALESYLDKEIDVRTIVQKMVVNIQERAAQVFDLIQEDKSNVRIDRTLIEWFSVLADILSKYDTILNPPNNNQEQVNIQNNINIQVLDTHMNAIYDIIREILMMLDYETSLRFIELWTEKTQALLKTPDQQVIPVEQRLVEAKQAEQAVEKALNQ